MHLEQPAITFLPCEERLPTIEGNVDYLALHEQLTTMDELFRSSGLENDFVARSLKALDQSLMQSKIDQIELSWRRPMRCDCRVVRYAK